MADPAFPVVLDDNEVEDLTASDTPDASSHLATGDIEAKKSYDLQEMAEPVETTRDLQNLVPGYPVPVGDIFCWKHANGISSFFSLTWKWLVVNRPQILSGITVALAQIPEAVSFSFVAGVDPVVGLQSAWIMGIITSLFGGRPGMVAGSTGAIAIVLPKIVEKGVGYMFYAIMLAGVIQMIFGLLRLGVLVRMIPHPVMVGFCNGLGIVIGAAQFNIFKTRPDEEARALLDIGGAFDPFTNDLEWINGKLCVLCMSCYFFFYFVFLIMKNSVFFCSFQQL